MQVEKAVGLAVVTALVVGCGPPDDSGDGEAVTRVERFDLAESTRNVLAWNLTLETSRSTSVEVTVSSESDEWKVSSAERAELHELLIAGLRPQTDYTIVADVTGDDGLQLEETTTLTTSSLPEGLPPMAVETSVPQRMSDGFTLFNVFRWPAGENAPDDEAGWLFVVDASGEPVWYASLDHRTDDAQLRDNGRLLYVRPNEEIVELDVSGEVTGRWIATNLRDEEVPDGAIGVAVDSFHHEVEVLPNGNFLTLATELREISTEQCPNYEPSSGDALNVVGDVVVEFDPETGDVVQEISTFEALDPCRRTDRGFEAGFWNAAYGGSTTQDWTHGNAAFYDGERELVVVSLRHLDWVVAYDYAPGDASASGDVAWILGAPDQEEGYGEHPGFDPDGAAFEWQYHQHAPMFTAAGTLLLYDNGNLRPQTNFDPQDEAGDDDRPYTRAVEYAIDRGAGTVEQVWEWQSPSGDYAPFVGDADELDNGNVLVTDGGILDPPSDAIRNPAHRKLARISEVERESGEVVFELLVADEGADADGYTVYRSERVAGFPR